MTRVTISSRFYSTLCVQATLMPRSVFPHHYCRIFVNRLKRVIIFLQMHIIWQISADPYEQAAGASTMHSTYSESHRQVPDMPFDPSLMRPLSPSNVRTGIEVKHYLMTSGTVTQRPFSQKDSTGGDPSRPLLDEALNCDSYVAPLAVQPRAGPTKRVRWP